MLSMALTQLTDILLVISYFILFLKIVIVCAYVYEYSCKHAKRNMRGSEDKF